ncbi:MAG: chloride channel protein [Patescibacteria group bacterium]
MKSNALGTNLKILIVCALVGILVALVYLVFEAAVSHSTVYVWDTLFHSDTYRLMVFPLAIILGLLFFGLQHWLAPGSDKKETHSLGGEPIKPTLKNLGIILVLGFFSLLAGASLGPEAILVPASVLVGSFLGIKLFKQNKQIAGLMAGAAMMALMAAFFHSFFVGLLSVLLVAHQLKTPINAKLIVVAIIASAASYATLQLIDPSNTYLVLPPFSWEAAITDILVGGILIVLGYLSTFGVKYAHAGVEKIRSFMNLNSWWKLGLFASTGLAIIYFIGGSLIEFTGNKSIAPLAEQATSLGLFALIVILIMKIIAIAWSRAMGYRGGLIFPMIFVASALVIILIHIFPSAHFGVGLIAALVGILAAEKKAKILL